MAKKDPRIDAYISQSAPFARPILKHLRKIIRRGCPAVEETMKWQFPYFEHHGMICGMAAFKTHCAFGFWKAELVLGDRKEAREAMGQFGRIGHVTDLPAEKILIGYVRKAAALNEAGVEKPYKKAKPFPVLPPDFAAALRKNTKAHRNFKSFSPSKKREYIEWIVEAKREETRTGRMKTALDWIAQGKIRNWKHV